MKRILDRMGKAATKQSTSVQPFAGGILNKYKTGTGRKTFERLALSHVIKNEPTITQQTLHVQVVAPKAAAPNVGNNKKALPSPERKPERIMTRERVTVERETIVFRDVTHIIKELRTIREIAIAQPVQGKETNDGALHKTGISKQLDEIVNSSIITNRVKHDHSKRIIPHVSQMPTQPLKAEQRADYYKWLQAKLQPGIVIQSLRKLDNLNKPLAKDRAQLKSNLKQANDSGASLSKAPLQLTNARRAVVSQEQREAEKQSAAAGKVLSEAGKRAEAVKLEQREAEKRSAAAGKVLSEAGKRAEALKLEQREADKRSAAAGKVMSEAGMRAEAVKLEQREAEKQSGAAGKVMSEAGKRAEAEKLEQREAEKQSAAAGKVLSEAGKRAEAEKLEQREAEKQSAAASKVMSEAGKRAEAEKLEQREAEKQSAAAGKVMSEAGKRAEAVKLEQLETATHTFRTLSSRQDDDVLPQEDRAKGKKQLELKHRNHPKHISEQTEMSQEAAPNGKEADVQSNVSAKKKNQPNRLAMPNAESETEAAAIHSSIKVTASKITDVNRNRLQLLVLQRKPQLLNELTERSSQSAIAAKRLIHRADRSQSDQPREADNDSTVNLNNSSMIIPVVPSHKKEIKATADGISSNVSSRKRNETKPSNAATSIHVAHAAQATHAAKAGISAVGSQRFIPSRTFSNALAEAARIRNRNMASRPAPMVLRRFEQRQPAQSAESVLRQDASKASEATALKKPSTQLNYKHKAATDHNPEGIIRAQSRRAILHKRTIVPESQTLSHDANFIQGASATASRTDASARAENLSKMAELKPSKEAGLNTGLAPVTVRGQLIARAANNKKTLLKNGASLSHKRRMIAANHEASISAILQNAIQGKRKGTTMISPFSPANTGAKVDSASPLVGRTVHRFAAEWLPSEAIKTSAYGVENNNIRQASTSLVRRLAEQQTSPNTKPSTSAEAKQKPVESRLVQRQVRKNSSTSVNKIEKTYGAESLNDVASKASQPLSNRFEMSAEASESAKAFASMRAYPTLSVHKQTESGDMKLAAPALPIGERNNRSAQTNPVHLQTVMSSFLNSGSRAGVTPFRTIQRHSGFANLAAKASKENKPMLSGLTSVVQAGFEPSSVQSSSAIGDQVRLSYTAAARHRNTAGQAAPSGAETNAASFGERGEMPTLSHHKPSGPAAQEPPRQVKVEAPRELDPVQLQKMIMKMPQLHPEAIADQVYKALERKMKLEQRRRGF
ncbi:hypothetical protein BK120_12905 [Paenibacillus sp. FSL A5-0031]|uniref:hypothetical protein n=1 Tax=Paenibacillus sp. FSL A5-0031 TaxID=1920420 RepID=UPI00096D2304|nr:hypothetical protein [Paenibacillus sp. FSL A5-0031]OME84006.1 hypothetical protein BK120_12905 [Paenibacillus sp. FSL A5-0031]